MNKIKIYENADNFIELSEEGAELLLCKHIVNPCNTEISQFIFNNFNPVWFKSNERKNILKIAKAYWNKYENIPSAQAFDEMFKNKMFVNDYEALKNEYKKINDCDISTYEDKFIKNVVTTYSKNKAIYFAILEKVEEIEKDGAVSDLVDKFEKILQMDLNEDLGIEYFENLENHCKKLLEKTDKTPFGFSKLDKYTYGGLPSHDTCLFLIMAAPGQGKSQLMMNIAYNWVMKNKNVLVISLEMSEEMYSRRFDALFADLNPNNLKDNVGILKSRIQGVKAGIPNGQLRIKEFPTGTMTTSMLRQYLKKLKATTGFEPDIIFVDYLNIMKPNNYGVNTSLYEKCGRISEELRALSGEKKIPIVSATQANRGSANGGYAGENIDINNVSESSGITATVDGLIALYQLEGERELGRINIKILKNRLGGYVGVSFPLKVDYEETLRMEDAEEIISVNDDVLGDVQDASDVMFKKQTNKISKSENSIEDL